MGVWSSGMILALGKQFKQLDVIKYARGPGFNSQYAPINFLLFYYDVLFYYINFNTKQIQNF